MDKKVRISNVELLLHSRLFGLLKPTSGLANEQMKLFLCRPGPRL